MSQSNVEVLNGKEAAAYLRIGYFTLMRKAKNGDVPSFRIGGRVLFRKSTLDGWIASQETGIVDQLSKNQLGVLRRISE